MNSVWKVIVSTASGGGKAGKHWIKIEALLKEKQINYSASLTNYQGHAIKLAEEAVLQGFRRIIAVGGDGAIHEIVNGIFAQKEVPTQDITLAIIPVGSGNDWARFHQIPFSYEEAVEVIAKSNTILQDVSRVESQMDGKPYSRYMINIGGLGFDAQVCKNFDELKARGKAKGGEYYKCVVRGFWGYSKKRFKILVDDNLYYEGDVFSVAMGIGKYSGGGLRQTPDAICDDGLIDLTVMKAAPKLTILFHVKKLLTGTIYKIPEVLHTTGKKLYIEAWPPSNVEVDGENVGFSPITVNVLEKAVRVVTNMDK